LTAEGKLLLNLRQNSENQNIEEIDLNNFKKITAEQYFNTTIKHGRPACDLLLDFYPPDNLLVMCSNRRVTQLKNKYRRH